MFENSEPTSSSKDKLRYCAGLNYGICEKETSSNMGNAILSISKKCQKTEEGVQQRRPTESEGFKVPIRANEPETSKGKSLLSPERKRQITEEGGKQWGLPENRGLATRGFMFRHKDTEWKTERTGLAQKQQEFALDDKKESEKQAGEEFCEDVKKGESDIDVTNSQLKDSPDRRSLLLLHHDLTNASKTASEKRSRKGTPKRSSLINGEKTWVDQNEKGSESNGLISRGYSPKNKRYDNWLNKCNERKKTNKCTELETGSDWKNREAKTSNYKLNSQEILLEKEAEKIFDMPTASRLVYCHGSYNHLHTVESLDERDEMKTRSSVEDMAETEDGISHHKNYLYGSELSNIKSCDQSFLAKCFSRSPDLSPVDESRVKNYERKYSKIRFPCLLSSPFSAKEEDSSITGPLGDKDITHHCPFHRRYTALPGMYSTISKEFNMAEPFSKEIPPGLQEWVKADESSILHKHPSLHDCTTTSGFRLIDPFYQWAYFKNINPTMYPVMAGDGMRPTDLWLSKSMPREGSHQLKRNLEVLNGGYHAESLDYATHVKFETKRHKSDRFNGNTESNKEETNSPLQGKREWSSNTRSQNGEHHDESMEREEHKDHHPKKSQKCDFSQESRTQFAHPERSWQFDSHTQNSEYQHKTPDQRQHAQGKEHLIKQEKTDQFEYTSEGTQKYAKVSLQERLTQESSKETYHFKDECQGIKEMRSGPRLDLRREENGLYESKKAAIIEPMGGNGLMNQLQKNGSSTFEGNNHAGTKHRHLPRCKEESQPWGKGSYSDLITMALASAPERKMTLDEIYRWITHNVPYFREKGGELTSSGWKNSVRHTLSVRQRFLRLPRMINGIVSHKSWWTLSGEFLKKRTSLELKAFNLLPQSANGKQANQETQTEDLICSRCSQTLLRD